MHISFSHYSRRKFVLFYYEASRMFLCEIGAVSRFKYVEQMYEEEPFSCQRIYKQNVRFQERNMTKSNKVGTDDVLWALT